MLTNKQHELLHYIYERFQSDGVTPSYEEMKEAMGLKSKSGIHRIIIALEERGFIRRLPKRARAIEVMRIPNVVKKVRGASAGLRVVSNPALEEPRPDSGFNKAPERAREQARKQTTTNVPLMGCIAAGSPATAIENLSCHISVPADFLTQGRAHFALEVRGDSMIQAGIFDADYVIIQKGEEAHSGDIVVALIDKEEATLKRLRRKGNSIALEAANPLYETRIYGPERISIQGRLVGLMRRY